MAIPSNPNSRPNPNSRNPELNSPMRRSFSGNPFQRPSIHTNPRSFVPATPANSPAEFLRTNSLGKEEKENEKDHETLKPAKARSPAVSRGSSHFMMPTLSAASKTNPSPRKKVLADRNEPLRTSLSFSDGKSQSGLINNFTENFDQKPDKGFDSKDSEIAEDVFVTPSKTIRLPKCPSHDSQTSHSLNFSESSDIKPIMESITKLSASSISPSPSIAPLDADPSLPPYDPKTNYLSPRPQFLHYKPNPRLELYYQKGQGNGTKNLEDSFLSESSTDSEVSEESEPEKSQKESEDDSSVQAINEISEKELDDDFSVAAIDEKSEKEFENDSLVKSAIDEKSEKEFENDSLVKAINEKSEKELEDEVVEPEVSEPEPITTFENDSLVEAINEKSEKEPEDVVVVPEVFEPEPITTCINSTPVSKVKSSFFTRAKVIPLLLVLLIAGLSLSYTHSPIIDSPVFGKLSSSKFYQENIYSFARNLKQWSVHSTSYVNELITNFSRGDKLGPLQFSNQTSMLEDSFIELKKFDEIYGEDEVEPVFEDEDGFESQLDQNLETDIDSDCEMIQHIVSNSQNDIDFEKKSCPGTLEFSPDEAACEVMKGDDQISDDYGSEIESTTAVPSFGDDHLVSVSKIESSPAVSNIEAPFGMDISISEVQSSEQGDYIVSDSEIEPTIAVPNFGNTCEIRTSQVETTTVEPESGLTLEVDTFNLDLVPEYKSWKQYEAVAMSLLAIALITAPVLIYLKNKKSETSITRNNTMKTNPSPLSNSPELDLVGDSCPSEMSSFDKSYSYSKGGMWGTTNEAHSQERRRQKRVLKRESLASSSEYSTSDSPSYGSFTTYERLPIKHGYGDDEVVTPVRRSSRIKKIQVISS